MTIPQFTSRHEVVPLAQARKELSSIIKNFRVHPDTAEPVTIGCYRRAEAVLLPIGMYEDLMRLMATLESVAEEVGD